MDMTSSPETAPERVIHLSLAAVLVGFLVLVGISLVGGFAAVWWWQPNPVPLPNTADRLVTTIQEVTISPSTAVAESVKQHERSVVLLSRTDHPEQILGTGLVVTSDGLVATTITSPPEAVFMIDDMGHTSPLALAGSDVVFGLTYYRAGSGVFVPFEVRDSEAPVGATLTLLSRNPETLTPRVQQFLTEEYRLPERNDPVGWQRLLGGQEFTEVASFGSPLLDDEGRVAGIVLPEKNGRVLPGTLLRFSLERVANKQLEQNPYDIFGLNFDYVFVPTADTARAFQVVVESVRANSSAAAQGVRPGDVIAAITGKTPQWETPLYPSFQASENLELQLRRGETSRTLTLTQTPAASPVP